MHKLAAGTREESLFIDDVRCPVYVEDLAAALLELAASDAAGVRQLAGADAVSRHELGALIARRDGLDVSQLRTGLRAQRSALRARCPRGQPCDPGDAADGAPWSEGVLCGATVIAIGAVDLITEAAGITMGQSSLREQTGGPTTGKQRMEAFRDCSALTVGSDRIGPQ